MKNLLAFLESMLRRLFYDNNATALVLLLLFLTVVLVTLWEAIFPVVVALIAAYTLSGITMVLHDKLQIHRTVATLAAFSIGLALMLATIPVFTLVSNELVGLVRNAPQYYELVRIFIQESLANITNDEIRRAVQANLQEGQGLLQSGIPTWLGTMASLVPSLAGITLYIVVIPILTLMMMLEARTIKSYIVNVLPAELPVGHPVWHQTDKLLSTYIRSKIVEIILVTLVTAICFYYMGLQYALLLSILSGLSVLIPVIGAIAVTVPIVILSLVQFGNSSAAYFVITAYVIIQLVDGYVLVPILYARTMQVSPLVVLSSVMICSNLWGIWGAVFAVPLVTFIGLLIDVWKNSPDEVPLKPLPDYGEKGALPLANEAPDIDASVAQVAAADAQEVVEKAESKSAKKTKKQGKKADEEEGGGWTHH